MRTSLLPIICFNILFTSCDPIKTQSNEINIQENWTNLSLKNCNDSLIKLKDVFGFYSAALNAIPDLKKDTLDYKNYADFNFYDFRPLGKQLDTINYYKIGYIQNNIKIISRYNKEKELNYDLYISDTGCYLLMSTRIYDDLDRNCEEAYIPKGFFVLDKLKKSKVYYFDFIIDGGINDYFIMQLDEKLNVISKLHAFKNRLLSISDYFYNAENILEKDTCKIYDTDYIPIDLTKKHYYFSYDILLIDIDSLFTYRPLALNTEYNRTFKYTSDTVIVRQIWQRFWHGRSEYDPCFENWKEGVNNLENNF